MAVTRFKNMYAKFKMDHYKTWAHISLLGLKNRTFQCEMSALARARAIFPSTATAGRR